MRRLSRDEVDFRARCLCGLVSADPQIKQTSSRIFEGITKCQARKEYANSRRRVLRGLRKINEESENWNYGLLITTAKKIVQEESITPKERHYANSAILNALINIGQYELAVQEGERLYQRTNDETQSEEYLRLTEEAESYVRERSRMSHWSVPAHQKRLVL